MQLEVFHIPYSFRSLTILALSLDNSPLLSTLSSTKQSPPTFIHPFVINSSKFIMALATIVSAAKVVSSVPVIIAASCSFV